MVQLKRRLVQSDPLRTALEHALDVLPLGLIVVGARGRVRFMNQRAAAILDTADGLTIVKRQLVAARSDETQTLRQLVRQAVQVTPVPGTGADGLVTLARPSQRRPLQVLVSPVARRLRRGDMRLPAALMWVMDPEQEATVPIEILQRLYGLTPTESIMTQLLSQGRGLAYAAGELQVSLNTAKTYQKRIFAKLGVHRQAELVRLLSEGLGRVAACARLASRTYLGEDLT